MGTDPKTIYCSIGVDPDTETAVQKALDKLKVRVQDEGFEYVFSALNVNIYSITEEYKVSVVAELWFERIPREDD